MAQPIRYLSTYGEFINLSPLTYQDRFSSYSVNEEMMLVSPVLNQKGALVLDTTINKYRFFTTDAEYRTYMRGG